MTDSTRPLRETVAKLVGDGVTRHVNGVTSMRHNRTAIATVARQVSEDIEAVVLAETEQFDVELDTARSEVERLLAHVAGLEARVTTQANAITWLESEHASAENQQRVIDDQRTRIIAQAGVIDLMRPVVEHVSRGRSFADAGTYPDATARRALGALDDVILNSPQAREWLAKTVPPVGPGQIDTPAAFQQRIDAAVPGAVTALEAKIGNLSHALDVVQLREIEQNGTITRLQSELAAAKARIEEASLVRCWTNEDGKRLVFADDLLAALHPELAKPADVLAPQRVALATETGPTGLVLDETTGNVTVGEQPAVCHRCGTAGCLEDREIDLDWTPTPTTPGATA